MILDSKLKTICIAIWRRSDGRGIRAIRSRIAERHGLRVVRGRIPVRDLRIEYQTPKQELARIDLELATEHYRFKNIAQKTDAGFAISARAQDAPHLRRVLEQREISTGDS